MATLNVSIEYSGPFMINKNEYPYTAEIILTVNKVKSLKATICKSTEKNVIKTSKELDDFCATTGVKVEIPENIIKDYEYLVMDCKKAYAIEQRKKKEKEYESNLLVVHKKVLLDEGFTFSCTKEKYLSTDGYCNLYLEYKDEKFGISCRLEQYEKSSGRGFYSRHCQGEMVFNLIDLTDYKSICKAKKIDTIIEKFRAHLLKSRKEKEQEQEFKSSREEIAKKLTKLFGVPIVNDSYWYSSPHGPKSSRAVPCYVFKQKGKKDSYIPENKIRFDVCDDELTRFDICGDHLSYTFTVEEFKQLLTMLNKK